MFEWEDYTHSCYVYVFVFRNFDLLLEFHPFVFFGSEAVFFIALPVIVILCSLVEVEYDIEFQIFVCAFVPNGQFISSSFFDRQCSYTPTLNSLINRDDGSSIVKICHEYFASASSVTLFVLKVSYSFVHFPTFRFSLEVGSDPFSFKISVFQ